MDDTSSESGSVTSQSERVVENKNKSSILHVSAKRPNTMQDEPPLKRELDDPGENTSDEDQEDLPYDGDLGSPYFNQTAGSQSTTSSQGRETVHASPDGLGLLESTPSCGDDPSEHLASVEFNAQKPAIRSQEDTSTKQENFFAASKPVKVSSSCLSPASINQLLLHHFSQEELLQPGRLIEAETLPEVSLLESMDDTVLSRAPIHNDTTVDSNHSGSSACHPEHNQSVFSDRSDGKSQCASKNSSSEEEAGSKIDHVTSAADSSASSNTSMNSNQSSGNSTAVDGVKLEKPEEDNEVQKVPFVRTRSFSEMKYGQGQVHYPMPDFSKVAPKVKIPKATCAPSRPVPQGPSTMHRAQSSPGMLDVISRVLEDSIPPPEKPYVFKDEEKQTPPALVHHLQVENCMNVPPHFKFLMNISHVQICDCYK